MALFKIDGQKLTAIADAIRAYTGSEATMTPDAMAVKVESVHAAGYTSGWDQGLQDGQALGRQEGYASGKADGIEEGYTSGKADGLDEGYTQGHVEGYNTGYENGNKEGYTSGYRDGSFEGYDTGKAEGIEQGKQAEYDAFWDAFQKNGTLDKYQFVFAGNDMYDNGVWNDTNFKPKYDIILGYGYSGEKVFYGCGVSNIAETLERLGVKFDTTNCGHMYQMFQNTATSRIPELNCTNAHTYASTYGLYYTFANSKVKTIDKLIVPENLKYEGTFNGCSNLENITFEGVIGNNISFKDCKNLTHTSLMNIINHLKDFSGTTTTRTLTLGTTNLAKLTDTEKAIATNKGWTLA